MPENRRKKTRRMRGSMTHGWGSKKKHRGSGNRGGFGMAGTGKRADQKKPSIINEYGLQNYFGKHGFIVHSKKEVIKSVNLSYIDTKIDSLVHNNLAKKEKEHYVLDLSSLGYDKLLGSGSITKKLIITARFFSRNAIRKLEESGGQAITAKKES